MEKRYRKLLRVDFRSDFAVDGYCRDLTATPSPVTSARLRQLDLLIKWLDTGFELYYGETDPARTPLFESGLPVSLCWALRPTHPFFANYTDLPFVRDGEQTFYFSNRPNEERAGEATPLELGRTPAAAETHHVGADDLRPAGAGEQALSFAPFTVNSPRTVTLRTEDGREIYTGKLAPDLARAGTLPINFAGEDWGPYEVEITTRDRPEADRRFAVHHLPAGNWGYLRLHLTPESLPATPEPLHYQLSFRSRSTRWRYFLIDRSGLLNYRLRLKNGQEELAMELEQAPLLPSGEAVYPFSTERVIPFREEQPVRLRLEMIDSVNSAKVAFALDLPQPSIERIYPERSGEQIQFYSDMYVYI